MLYVMLCVNGPNGFVRSDPPDTCHTTLQDASSRAMKLYPIKKDSEEVRMLDWKSQSWSVWDGEKWVHSATVEMTLEAMAREFEEQE